MTTKATVTATNILPTLTAATTDTEMLVYLRDPTAAMGFALDHLEDFELRPFLLDWKVGADMTPWLKGWRADKSAGLGDWSGHERHLPTE